MLLTMETFVKNLLVEKLNSDREEQKKIIGDLGHYTHAVLEGSTGSGKTWVAVEFCRQMASANKSVVFVSTNPSRPDDDEPGAYTKHNAKTWEELNTHLKDKKWHCVVIDDGQNLPFDGWKTFLAETKAKHVLVILDTTRWNENFRTIPHAFEIHCGKKIPYKKFELRGSHRHSRKVESFIKQKQQTNLDHEKDMTKSMFSQEGDGIFLHIPTPGLEDDNNSDRLCHYILALVKHIVENSQSLNSSYIYKYKNIAVLCDTSNIDKGFGNKLVQDIRKVLEDNDDGKSSTSKVIVDTYENFQGKDSEVVLFVLRSGVGLGTLDHFKEDFIASAVSMSTRRFDFVYQGNEGAQVKNILEAEV